MVDIATKVKEIIKKEYGKEVSAIYKYGDYYYTVIDDFLASMIPFVDLELETSPGFIDRYSDIANKVLFEDNLIYEEDDE